MTQQSPVAEPTPLEVLVGDPLSPVTRKERVYLLAVSMASVAVVKTGLVPTKIATFGIELDKPNRSNLLLLLAAVTAYFLVAFVVYAASDYVARREAIKAARSRILEQSTRQHQEAGMEPILGPGFLTEEEEYEMLKRLTETRAGRSVGLTRVVFEFLLPMVVGAYAVYSLLVRSPF